ncbi:MAG: family 78 glycoside hydrolase catalytic domain [Bacteroidetes bacterium]|nr:family 78 glycoside hydrolase catalytic domain [Bacteroidota bacterium]
MKKIFVLVVGLLSMQYLYAQVSVSNLRCERLENPLGIDVAQPALSWQINSTQRSVEQQAYQVIVASSIKKLNQGIGDIWNSGKVISDQSVHVLYGGKALQSRTTCYWKVKVVTSKGVSKWSKPAMFSIGLLNQDDWKSKWIGYDRASPWDSIVMHSRLSARYVRKEFASAQTVKSARVYIAGLGLYELFINGKKVGVNVLTPSPTDYRKTVLYNTYDVTSMIRAGKNAIAATLSNGRFFNMRQNFKTDRLLNFGFPKMLLQLEIEYSDGSKKIIVSDETWKLNVDGPVRSANEYDGEEYDATKELNGWSSPGYNDTKWLSPEIVEDPGGIIHSQMNEPMQVMKTIRPVSITKMGESDYILDMGQNFAGWLQLKVKGKRGTKVTMRFAESLQDNGSLFRANLRSAYQANVYTLKGGGIETWHPSFIYNGFRFVEITGYPTIPTVNDFEGLLVYDAFQTTGLLQTSDTIINKVLKNAWWGIASNYKGMPIDCPQRDERQPWLGDRTTGCYGESFLFDNEKLYAKWLNDMQDAQSPEGTIPDIAPAYKKYYTDNVTWPGTYLTVADMLYKQFGDEVSVIKHYSSMSKWMKMMEAKYMKNYLVAKDNYGDWCVPPESLELIHAKDSMLNTDGELIASSYYYYFLGLMQKFATISHNEQDIPEYAALAANVKNAFNNKFYNTSEKYYGNNSVTSNLLPLSFGMVADEDIDAVFKNIVAKISVEKNNHISTGVIGTQWLMRGLTRFNRADLAFTLASNKTYPSWGYMAESGATTIWELWNGKTANPWMNSQNHVMLLGDLLIWLYENAAGIKTDNKEVAFKKIIMKPVFSVALKNVNASYQSPYGMINSSWKKENGKLYWSVTIPPGSKAVVYIPASKEDDVLESGRSAKSSNDIHFLRTENGNAVYEIGSGKYSFSTNSSFIK